MHNLNLKIRPAEIANALERTLDRLYGVYEHRPAATQFPALAKVAEKFGFEIVAEASSNERELSFEEPSSAQKQLAAELLESELSVYSARILHATRVERIVVCNNMLSHGDDVAGVTQMGPFVIDTLFLDMHKVSRNWQFARQAVHHELFHAIDYVDDLWHYIDTEWFHLNDPDFRYDRSLCGPYVLPTEDPGFLTNYSMVAVHEDKAEVYCHLIIGFNHVMKRVENDPILKRKVEYMQNLLHKFCDDFDDEFWRQCGERGEATEAKSHTDWRDVTKRFEQLLRIQGRDRSLDLSPNEIPLELTVWRKEIGDRQVWHLQHSDGHSRGDIVKFYTFNKLRNTLLALGVKDELDASSLAKGCTLHGAASAKTLTDMGLIGK